MEMHLQFTAEQVASAFEALGLDPKQVESANLSHQWVRVVLTNRDVVSVAVADVNE